MGFSKQAYEPEVAVEVRHSWYPGEAFIFYFPKVLPQSALDAEAAFLGLKQDEEKDTLASWLRWPRASARASSTSPARHNWRAWLC